MKILIYFSATTVRSPISFSWLLSNKQLAISTTTRAIDHEESQEPTHNGAQVGIAGNGARPRRAADEMVVKEPAQTAHYHGDKRFVEIPGSEKLPHCFWLLPRFTTFSHGSIVLITCCKGMPPAGRKEGFEPRLDLRNS